MTDQITSIRLDIEAELAKAQTCLNYLGPVTNFVAVNALKGFEEVDFDLAMHNINELMGAQGYMDLAKTELIQLYQLKFFIKARCTR